MGLGIRKQIRQILILKNQLHAKVLHYLFGLDVVTTFLRCLDKGSTMAILQQFGAKIGQGCDIESGLILHGASNDFSNLRIDGDCHIGKGVFFDLKSSITMHRGSTISMQVTILTHIDVGNAQGLGDRYSPKAKPVEIGPDAYIGAGAIIMRGVTIGAKSIVGAGALVNQNVPPYNVFAGVPARMIRQLGFRDEVK
jgi:acetyltransferase-like isoleucine patch superfamily enzyme